MKTCTQKIFNELIQPLKAAINETLTGSNTIATALPAEILLASLPSMLIYNVAYNVVKQRITTA